VWEDELVQAALNVVPALLIGGGAVRLIFGHPAGWVYLVGVAVAAIVLGAVRRAIRQKSNRGKGSR
jgi:hypothetical protein